MRKPVVLVLFALIAGTLSARAETVRIGTEASYAPFESRDASGAFKGYDIDVGNALCAAAKLTCEWVNQDFDGLIEALKTRKIDAVISQMSITDERKKQVDFSDVVTIADGQFVAKKDSGITDDPATLKGKTVGVQSGTTHERYLNAKLAGIVTVKVYQSQDDAFLDLENGRVDATLADKTIDFDWLKKTGKGEGFDFVGKPIDDPVIYGEGTGIAVRKGDTALLEAFNKALVTITKNGTFKTINDRYFPFDIRGSAHKS